MRFIKEHGEEDDYSKIPDAKYIHIYIAEHRDIVLFPEKRSIVAKFVGARLRRLIYRRRLLLHRERSGEQDVETRNAGGEIGVERGKDDGARGVVSRIPSECFVWSINNNHAICWRITAREFVSRALIGAPVVASSRS